MCTVWIPEIILQFLFFLCYNIHLSLFTVACLFAKIFVTVHGCLLWSKCKRCRWSKAKEHRWSSYCIPSYWNNVWCWCWIVCVLITDARRTGGGAVVVRDSYLPASSCALPMDDGRVLSWFCFEVVVVLLDSVMSLSCCWYIVEPCLFVFDFAIE